MEVVDPHRCQGHPLGSDRRRGQHEPFGRPGSPWRSPACPPSSVAPRPRGDDGGRPPADRVAGNTSQPRACSIDHDVISLRPRSCRDACSGGGLILMVRSPGNGGNVTEEFPGVSWARSGVPRYQPCHVVAIVRESRNRHCGWRGQRGHRERHRMNVTSSTSSARSYRVPQGPFEPVTSISVLEIGTVRDVWVPHEGGDDPASDSRRRRRGVDHRIRRSRRDSRCGVRCRWRGRSTACSGASLGRAPEPNGVDCGPGAGPAVRPVPESGPAATQSDPATTPRAHLDRHDSRRPDASASAVTTISRRCSRLTPAEWRSEWCGLRQGMPGPDRCVPSESTRWRRRG